MYKMIQSTWQNYGITTHLTLVTHKHTFLRETMAERGKERASKWKMVKRGKKEREWEMTVSIRIVECKSHFPCKPLEWTDELWFAKKICAPYIIHHTHTTIARGRLTVKKQIERQKKGSQDAGKKRRNILSAGKKIFVQRWEQNFWFCNKRSVCACVCTGRSWLNFFFNGVQCTQQHNWSCLFYATNFLWDFAWILLLLLLLLR